MMFDTLRVLLTLRELCFLVSYSKIILKCLEFERVQWNIKFDKIEN